MANSSYKKRIADRLLQEQLEVAGVVLVQGPKWCGKTTTAEQAARSVVYINDPDIQDGVLKTADFNIKMLLDGDTPRLFDEWQLIPRLWDTLRFEVDHRPQHEGQFILTGSAVPVHTSDIHHSGAGRFAWIRMRPMSLWESEESSGEVSLSGLFDGHLDIAGHNSLQAGDIAFLLCRGGWPAALGKSERGALQIARNYMDAIVESDLSRFDDSLRNAERSRRIMRSLARMQGTQTSINAIRQDMQSNEPSTLAENTIASYINALRNIFVVEDMKAWNTNLRSKTAIRSTDTRYFVDPSIATAALGLRPDDLMHDLNTFGLLFETMAVRDLRVYAEAMGGFVSHYRDKDGLECDAVVHLRNGRYGLVEIKLGGTTAIEEAQKSLNKLARKIDTDKAGEPAFRMVLTATGIYAYGLQDGTLVVPIGCLKD
ncbi:MAG: DUF4143 domain-containing protein [Paludibacteraceae bacterium]|nr:DUF4143 domain-containing protein [Paludibacteraceae bacterium]